MVGDDALATALRQSLANNQHIRSRVVKLYVNEHKAIAIRLGLAERLGIRRVGSATVSAAPMRRNCCGDFAWRS